MSELLHLERAALEPTSRAALDSHVRSYESFCLSARIQAFPVSFVSVGLFLVQYCRWSGHTARSIPSILSHLRRANRQFSSNWLSEEESWRLNDLTTTLRKKDATPSRQKLPITHHVMDAMQAAANLSNHQDFQLVTMGRVARDALLRGVELCKLLIGEVEWNASRTEVTICLHYSKAHKLLNAPERVTISDYGPGSGVAFLREYFRVMGLANKAPAYPLWPFIDDLGGVSWTTWTSKYKFIERSRQLLERAGYPSKHLLGTHTGLVGPRTCGNPNDAVLSLLSSMAAGSLRLIASISETTRIRLLRKWRVLSPSSRLQQTWTLLSALHPASRASLSRGWGRQSSSGHPSHVL